MSTRLFKVTVVGRVDIKAEYHIEAQNKVMAENRARNKFLAGTDWEFEAEFIEGVTVDDLVD